MSDVLAGAALGLASGYLHTSPSNFDFGKHRRSHGTLLPWAGAGSAGPGYLHVF